MCGFSVGERFKPHPNLKKVYYAYLLITVSPLIAVLALVIWAVYVFAPEAWPWAWPYALAPLIIVLASAGVVAYWIRRYYESTYFLLDRDEVIVERGVWWNMRHTVPYSRIMSVDVIQGPISGRT